jgi:hypothetical protein
LALLPAHDAHSTASTRTQQNSSLVISDKPAGRDEAEDLDNDSAAVLIDRFHQDFAMVDIEDDKLNEIPPLTYKDVYNSPSSYDKAWNHLDPW